MSRSVSSRRTLAAGTAAAVAAVDLLDKVVAGNPFYHVRSAGAVLLMALVAIGLVAIVPRLPSTTAAVGAGVAAGGAVGNLVGALAWAQGVPDPIVAGGIAFNLADVSVLVGDALLLAATAVHAVRHRAWLRTSV